MRLAAMTDTAAPAPSPARRARAGGAAARRDLRQHAKPKQLPAILRRSPLTEVLNEEGLQIVEGNAETILQEIGIEFRDDPEALALLKGAGCD
ncbi:MAG: trimethylamine methyltransferase family protein, partial [Rhodospirillales bacterium]